MSAATLKRLGRDELCAHVLEWIPRSHERGHIEAAMKLACSGVLYSRFRAHMSAATLKHGGCGRSLDRQHRFRAHMSAATLKRSLRAQQQLTQGWSIPRSHERGHIEAPTYHAPSGRALA